MSAFAASKDGRALLWGAMLLFAIGQGLLAAHSSAHPLVQSDTSCQVCLLSPHGGAVACRDQTAPRLPPDTVWTDAFIDAEPNDLYLWSGAPRAPPPYDLV